MADEGGYYQVVGVGDIMPTIDEVRVPNFEYISTFTADTSANTLTTADPHTQLAGEVVMLTSTGTLPHPFNEFEIYRVCSPGLSSSTLKLASNDAWNPPPESPPIDITSTGSGTHYMWIRPLEYISELTGDASNNYVTTEDIGVIRGAIYFGNAVRHQLRGGAGLSGVTRNHDYWSDVARRTPRTKWKIAIGGSGGDIVPLISGGSAALYTYGYPAKSSWGLGLLGAVVGFSEAYYHLCGDCAFGGGPPGGGGGGGGAGGQNQLDPDRQIKIEYKDKDITNLVRRAQRASSTIENMKIVGQGVSGGAGAWQINPD